MKIFIRSGEHAELRNYLHALSPDSAENRNKTKTSHGADVLRFKFLGEGDADSDTHWIVKLCMWVCVCGH